MTDATAWLDATAQLELIRRRELSAEELVHAAIERMEMLNPQLNAVIHPDPQGARSRPGVPFLLKDVLATEAGRPYHCGLRAAREGAHLARTDSWLVQRYRHAGFCVLGRTNTPELATTVTTEPLAYGPTRNPWDPSRTPGGSSGGSAAAVASGMVAAAHGNDMGGSIRVPAANCGLVGLKPTRARTSLAPDFGEFWGPITHQHVLTRTVRDCAAILDATAGPAPGDPYTAPPSPLGRPWAAEVGTDPGPLRIGYRFTLPEGRKPHPEVVSAVEATAGLLEDLGHRVGPEGLPALGDPALQEAVPPMLASIVAREDERWSAILGHDITAELEPMNAALAELGRSVTATQWLAGLEVVQAWSRRMAEVWTDHEIVVLPVTPEPPLLLGEMAPDAKDAAGLIADLTHMITFTLPYNLTGEPAVSLPLHWTPEEIPIGVQLVAPIGREDLLFRLAGQLEQARPWSSHRPAIAAS